MVALVVGQLLSGSHDRGVLVRGRSFQPLAASLKHVIGSRGRLVCL